MRDERIKIVGKNITLSYVFLALSYIVNFLLVPVLLNELGSIKYGIFTTVFSVLMWTLIFNNGLGNSLKNLLIVSFLNNKLEDARHYIATTYIVSGFVMIGLLSAIIPLISLFDWNELLNTEPSEVSLVELSTFLYISVTVFFLVTIGSYIVSIYSAKKITMIQHLLTFIQYSFYMLLIYLFVLNNNLNLVSVISIYGVASMFAYLFFNIRFFRSNRELIPKMKNVSFDHFKKIFSLGKDFLVIQLTLIILFSTDNILIITMLGPKDVTTYSIIYKLFSMIIVILNVIMGSLWPNFTEAYEKKDIAWIKKVLKMLIVIFLAVVTLAIILGYFLDAVLIIWLGTVLDYPKLLIIIMVVYVFVHSISSIFGSLLSSINKVKEQRIMVIIQAAVNIPLSVFFVKVIDLGISGIILGTVISLLISAIWCPIILYKEIFSNYRNKDGVV